MTTVQANAAASASSPAATSASAKGKTAGADFMTLLEDINGQAIAENADAAKTVDGAILPADTDVKALGKNTTTGTASLASDATSGKGSITIEAGTGLVSEAGALTAKPIGSNAIIATTDATEENADAAAQQKSSAASKSGLLAESPDLSEQAASASTTTADNKDVLPVVAKAGTSGARAEPAASAAPVFIASDVLPISITGQKLPPAGKAATITATSQPATSDLALGQAAALTVTATPIVVPLATPPGAKATNGADHQLDAQFSAFTSTPAADKEAATASTADADEGGEGDADSEITTTKASLSDSTANANIAPSRFSSEVTQVLSLVQAGQAHTPKEAAADGAVSSPVNSTDNSLSAAGLTLIRQPDGQGLVTSFTNIVAPAATPQLVYQAPVDQVSIVMQQAAANQNSAMMIALEPAELGRVEISLKFGKNGTVQADVTADNAQTLNWLKGDQSVLHQALQNAGLNPDSSSLSFNLSDGQAQQQQQNTNGSNSQSAGIENDAGSDGQVAGSTIQYTVQPAGNGHINFFA